LAGRAAAGRGPRVSRRRPPAVPRAPSGGRRARSVGGPMSGAPARQVEAPGIAAPEPELTPQALIDRAIALRPKLIAAQADTEERTYHSEELHRDFLDAGFYRLYVPRRYGGYEFD